MVAPALLSSKTIEWATPQDFFDRLNEEFSFTLDVCATEENTKCPLYFSKEENGLAQSWARTRVWCNPPYGKEIAVWVARCAQTSFPEPSRRASIGAPDLAVMLLPARTDTRWWHTYVIPYAFEVRFIRGRLKFGGAKNSAPFPSAVVVYRPRQWVREFDTVPRGRLL